MTVENFNIHVDVTTRVKKPIAEVYEAVVNPEKLAGYFVSSSTGKLETGKKVFWNFANHKLEITVIECVKNEKIVFEWEADKVDYQTRVEMTFTDQKEKGTLVRIVENGWKVDPTALASSYSHTEGWVQMQNCMKAFVEYGIDLRNGSGGCSID